MELVAEAPKVQHPSVVACAPDGRVFVAEDPMDISLPQADAAEGRILCLHPDGHVTVFAEKLYAVFGLQYLEGKVYVLHNPKFSVFDDDNGVGRNRRELIEQTLPNPSALNWNDHIPANFRLGMDGFFYVACGDKGLHGAKGTDGSQADLFSGGIFRIRPDGTRLEVVAHGVRNILGLLTETYSYASFKTRITETYWFLEEVLGYVAKNGGKIRDVVATANGESVIGQQLAVRQELVKAPDLKTIVFAPTMSTRNPYVADRPYRLKADNAPSTTAQLPFYGTTVPTETSLAPRVWVIPMSDISAAAAPTPTPTSTSTRGAGGGTPTQRLIAGVIDRLEAHGITYTVTDKDIAFKGERYRIATNTIADREYQGTHKARTLTGAWDAAEQSLPVGSLIIPMDQPLARLAFILFDPRSDDGFMWWNILDPILGQTPTPSYYPVLRSMNAMGN